ncbi:heavy metal-associated isoprenylated plant protein 47-like [Prosopis cineraria]|uniref:heavy metal-associated isoprenylated plant protein 47-like n=1 Tax=Prosopis cineraria TaxID=364024 RepID=UPI00240F1AFD|nr:heavy metal-associated isoprenylated plant protein 47-like [Prosopis cineraria]
MKQKVTIKVVMECESCRNKALKIASMIKGVSSVAIEGDSKDRVVVTGEDVDTVCLGKMLKKKFRGVTVLTVEEVKAKKEDEKDKKAKCCTVCIVPCKACPKCESYRCEGGCEPCSKCESHRCDGGCKACSKCESHKCDGGCKACSRCRSYRCHGFCAYNVCYGQCPPWISCPSCCVKPPYPCYRVVYDSQPDSCSIQ